ncbi:beta-ketoacyl synthase N-terminal-like domain-containing protein [Streptomyces sp. NBRC 110028]|uniref:beta-ketoacyl synthase N-terminal-like domain-containing protein n=1 Tax=Streptomyces sp. NBRC 110028 TaxID=1621260 RepID=UPI00351C4DB2
MTARQSLPPVAVVGMSVLLPGSPDLDTYWRNLSGGVDAITDVPAGRWDAGFYDPRGGGNGTPAAPDRVYCRRGGFVDTYAHVDAARFGIMPNSVSGTEPDQLIALGVAAAAIADAGGDDHLPDRERVGVVLGRGGYLTPGLARLDQRVRTAHQLVRTLGELLPGLGPGHLDRIRDAFTEQLGPDRPETAIGLVPNLAASRIANRLDLRGPAYTVDAACASSLVAVDQAVGELASGRCDVMLAGGVHHCHDITLWSVFSQLRALSPSQRIRPFDRAADGLLIGEGTGVVVLKRLADARRDGDRVYAVIRGTGVASDGRATGLVNPDPGGQTRAVRQAWRAAGLDPREADSIGLLEAHGTATPAGDAAELTTLAEVFGPGGESDGSAVIGSVKSMIGHTMPAAGVAGLVKAALAVHHGWLLPTLHCDDPHPGLASTRFRTLDAATPWEAPVRRAAVNAFGFGGINAHVVLEQEPAAVVKRRPAAVVTEPERVLALAVDTPERLAELLAADDATVRATAPAPVSGRGALTRLGIVEPTAKRLALARRVVAKGRPWRGRNDVWFTPGPLLSGPAGKLAFVFPGLEAEFEPRTDGIAEYFGLSRHTGGHPGERYGEAARAGDIGRHGVGVFGVGRLLNAALGRMGIVPDAVAGHSVGEWSAMAAGGLYAGEAVDAFLDSFDPDALRVPGVTFAVLGTGAERVLTALAERPDSRIVLSHDNAPSQSMVCGPRDDVEEFVRAMRATGVIAQVLPFQSGFHTPMLAPFLDPIRTLAERFELLLPPRVPVWSGTTAAPYPDTEAEVRRLFVRHLLEPVRFRLLIQALHDAGFRAFVQMGTGQLASLIGDTLQGRDHLVVAANSPHRDGVAQLRRVATALWTEGVPVDPALPRPGARARAARPPAPVRLNLDGALISLGERRLGELRDALRSVGEGAFPTPPLPGTEGLRPPAPHQAWPPPGPVGASTDGAAPPLPATDAPCHPARPSAASGSPYAASPYAASPHAATASAAQATPPYAAVAGRDHAAPPLPAAGEGPPEAPHAATAGAGPAAPPYPAMAGSGHVAPDQVQASPYPASAGTARVTPQRPATAGTARVTPQRPATASTAQATPPHAASAGAPRHPVPPRPHPGSPHHPARPTQPPPAAPWAAELDALLRETADVAVEVVAAGRAGRVSARARRYDVRVSTEAMPYLRDHCFFPQRPGWPDESDRWPVVPATTIVQHLIDAAAHAADGGGVAVAVHGARFDQWVTATPPSTVAVTVTPSATNPAHYTATFGRSARGTVQLAPHYPADRPAPWRVDPATERVPEHTAAQIYGERWMFHGPAFQGLTRLTAIGERHMRGTITTPAAPGALLDNVGQLLGYWIMATHTERSVVFPVGMRLMRFYGPHPRPGTEVECLVRIVALTDAALEADVQLLADGQVWAELRGWHDRRFDNHPQTRPVERFPQRNTLSQAQPGGWSLVYERWPDLASRDLIMRNHLGGVERAEYARQPPLGRRQWLLGRIAAKDAVRRWLWERGEGPVFPAEIRVCDDEHGRPYAVGVHGRTLPPLELTLAARAEAGVALVVPRHPDKQHGIGIGIEEVADGGEPFGPAERELLASVTASVTDSGSSDTVRWATAFRAAKAAVAKADGTGRDATVVGVEPEGADHARLTVEVATATGHRPRRYRVCCTTTANPSGLPDREYAVAWTTGPGHRDQDEETDQ